MAEADVPSHLLAVNKNIMENYFKLMMFFISKVYKYPESSEDLKKKAKKALKSILQMCSHLPALEPLISVINLT
jgi:hypothetical protein